MFCGRFDVLKFNSNSIFKVVMMKNVATVLFFIVFIFSGVVNATDHTTRMIDVSISKNGDQIISEKINAFDKVPASLEKIGFVDGFSNQFSLLITSEVQANGLIKTEVFTKIIDHSNYQTVSSTPQDLAKTFLLTSDKPAKYKIGSYWVQLVISESNLTAG
jgi:hypothetical protein